VNTPFEQTGPGDSSSPLRVVVVTPIPTPYRDPLWCELASRPEVDLQVLYCADRKSDRPWSLNWVRPENSEVLPARNLTRWLGSGKSCFWNPAIRSRLAAADCDALIVGGYNHLTMLWAIHFARRRGIPYFVMSESHLRARRSGVRRALKYPLVHSIMSHAAGGFPTGRDAAVYQTHYGAQPDRLCFVPNAPDVEALHRRARALRPHRADFRRQWGLTDAPLVLFAGRLLRFKGADVLLRAFAAANRDRSAQLAIIGDGPEAAHLQQLCRELNIGEAVRFVGFVEPEKMPEWYAAADVFVLPSSETWGVVVLEALASGVPVIVTDEVGCHPDVVVDPRIGDVVPARDPDRLADALARRLQHPVRPEVVAEIWSRVSEQCRYAVIADRMLSHLRTCIDRVPARSHRTHSETCGDQLSGVAGDAQQRSGATPSAHGQLDAGHSVNGLPVS